jgi:hypothetical protein
MKYRIAAWLVIVLALLAQVIAGAAGPGAQICVCPSGVSIERQGESCCASEAQGLDDRQGAPVPVVPSGCPDCHLIPLPDTAMASVSLAPILQPAAIPPIAPVAWAVIAWPPTARACALRDQEHPPPHRHLRFLRTVVITC